MRIGIDLGGTSVKAALCADDGAILIKQSVPTRTGDPDGLREDMKQLALALCEAGGVQPDEVESIGIGVPGSYDKPSCTLRFGTNLGMNDVCFAETFQPEFGCAVQLDNDANCAALGEAEGVPKDWILCGNGAADLIFRLALAKRPRHALVLAPTFAEYEAALETVGCDVRRYALTETNDFAMTEDVLGAIQPPVEIVFLCQPNNPTGQAADRTLMRRILAKCEEVGALLAVDECFLDFLPDGEALTMKPELAVHGGLFILKAFTKLYGMAGVRLGYGLCADTALLERMRRAGQPWEVSSLAQAAGLAALTQRDYVRQVRALIETERPYLLAGLRALGLRVIEGRANYLLFRADETLGERLEARGALIRRCGNYPGLDDTWYRTAVRTRRENDALLAALREVLA